MLKTVVEGGAMNNILLMGFALVVGGLVPLQLTFNSQLGGVTKNAFSASLLVFLVGTLALSLVVLFLRPNLPSLTQLAQAPKTIWLGGLIATFYIIAVVIITPKLGVALTVSLILVGQLCVGVLLDHLGAFGNPQHSLSSLRALGLTLMVAGAILIRKF
jgi:bacterial/archaeal transporter family-2 protein